MLPLGRNPLLYREWCTAGRPMKLWGTLVSVPVLAGMIFLFLYLSEIADLQRSWIPRAIDWTKVFVPFGAAILGIEFTVAYYFALGMTLVTVSRERDRRTQEFLTTLPVSPFDKALGLWIGRNILPLVALALLAPISALSMHAGGIDTADIVWLHLILFTGFAAAGAIGLGLSAGIGSWYWVILVVLPVAGLGLREFILDAGVLPLAPLSPYSMLGATFLREETALSEAFIPGRYLFFAWPAPWQVCPVAFQGFLAVLGFSVAACRLSGPPARPLPRVAVVLFYLVFQSLLVGSSTNLAENAARGYFVGPMMIVFFYAIFLWGAASVREQGSVMEWVGQTPRWAARWLGEALRDPRAPNYVALGLLWLVTMGGVLAMNWMCAKPASEAVLLLAGLVLLVYLWAYYSICLLGTLLFRRNGAALGLLLAIVAMGIPTVFAVHKTVLLHATPFGLFLEGNLLAGDSLSDAIPLGRLASSAWCTLGCGLVLLLLSGCLCAWRMNVLLGKSPLGRRSDAPAR